MSGIFQSWDSSEDENVSLPSPAARTQSVAHCKRARHAQAEAQARCLARRRLAGGDAAGGRVPGEPEGVLCPLPPDLPRPSHHVLRSESTTNHCTTSIHSHPHTQHTFCKICVSGNSEGT